MSKQLVALDPWEAEAWRLFVKLRYAVYGEARTAWNRAHPRKAVTIPLAEPGPLAIAEPPE